MFEKLNCYVKRVSIFLIAAALIAGIVGCDGGGGDGGGYPTLPPSQNLEIQTWYDLDDIRDNLAGNHTLMNDLDSTTAGYEELASPTANQGKGWEPIGTFFPEWGFMGFTGTFDGQGHEIRDLFINRPGEDDVGLFIGLNEIYGEGVIKDIGVVNTTVTGGEDVGGLVGKNAGTVSNSYSSGSVTGNNRVGSLVGANSGTVNNSYSTGSVMGSSEHAGGLVGDNSGTVTKSYSSGSVTGEVVVGGLVGWNFVEGTVSNCHSTGSVSGNSGVGGLVGVNFIGSVSNSYSSGNVIGNGDVGGLVGVNDGGTVSNSFYNYDEVLINGENVITVGALFSEDFGQWLANDKFLNVNERLSQEGGYYVVNDVADFKELLAFGQDGSLKFRLENDLDLATEPNLYIPYLAGELDGTGHKISNLSFNFYFVSQVGLFGYLAPDGKVTQVGVENINITGYSGVGGLVGVNDATVSDSYSSGSVNGNGSVGGLMGFNCGTVSNSYSTSTVTGDEYVGGLVGWNYGPVSNSYSTGSVTGVHHVGGLVGSNRGLSTVSNSYSTGNVAGDESVGGLVGSNIDRGTVSNSYSTGSVSGIQYVGGLVGWNEATVSTSFWNTETSGQATSAGGIGKTTAQMQDIATFSGATWDIIAVASPSTPNPSYTWNIVDEQNYPSLSWQS